jgi:hypothetical protein
MPFGVCSIDIISCGSCFANCESSGDLNRTKKQAMSQLLFYDVCLIQTSGLFVRCQDLMKIHLYFKCSRFQSKLHVHENFKLMGYEDESSKLVKAGPESARSVDGNLPNLEHIAGGAFDNGVVWNDEVTLSGRPASASFEGHDA